MSYTKFPDYILDEILPQMTPNGWRLLSFVWRKTEGYQKTSDEISYSQIADGTGIKGRSTISAAIKDVARFITVEHNTGRSNLCKFDISSLLNSQEIKLFSQEKSSEIEPFKPGMPIKSPVLDIKSPESGHTKETLTKENTTSDSFQESEVTTAREILDNPKDYSIKQIQQVTFTHSQYLQLRENEKAAGAPRKGLLKYIRDKLEPKPQAVEVYRSVVYSYPEKCLWADIEKAVGSNPSDLERWRDVVKNYIGLGWNKTNVVNMLNYFEQRKIPTMNGDANGPPPAAPKDKIIFRDKRTGEIIT